MNNSRVASVVFLLGTAFVAAVALYEALRFTGFL
jgi:hypothetical protein